MHLLPQMTQFGLVLSAVMALAIGCSRKDSSPTDAVAAQPDDGTAAARTPLRAVAFGPEPQQIDEFVMEAAAIAADTLTAKVSYGGGCKDHEFVLTAGEEFLESDPVQLLLTLTHDANGDACEAWLTEDLRFDLTGIRERYRTFYKQDSGVVVLRLTGAPDGDGALEYRF